MKKILYPTMVVLVLACTAGLYYLLFDKHSTIFYINVAVACVAELLLLANIPIWSGKKLLNVTNVSVSKFVNLYAIGLFLWTTFYTLAIHPTGDYNYKILIIGLLLITLPFVIFAGTTAISANKAEELAEEQVVKAEQKRNVIQIVQALHLDIETSLECNNSEWKDECLRLLRLAMDKLASTPIEKFSKNPDIAHRIEDTMTEIATMCDSLTATDDVEATQANITNRVNRLIKYITTVKSL
jgi:hypothetical protein